MEDVVCNGCSLICDDGTVRFEGSVAKSYGFCRLGHTYLLNALKEPDHKTVTREGEVETDATVETGLEHASSLLSGARHPLILIGSHSSNETIEETLSLSATLHAVFDSDAALGLAESMCHDIWRQESTADLDNVRNRCEFVLYWGTNPAESSHRHSSRFSVFPRGEKAPQGVESRVVGVVDVRETETMKMANHRIVIPIGSDSELAKAIVSELTGKSVVKGSLLGLPLPTFVGLVRALEKSDCTVILCGTGIMNSGRCEENLTALGELIQTLRGIGKEAYAMPIWQGANDMGAIVSTMKVAGRPGPVDFSDGAPAGLRLKGVVQMLAESIFDSVLVIGGDPLASLPGPAARRLAGTPTVYIGPEGGLTDKRALISVHVYDDIVVGSGCFCRIDGTEVRLKKWGSSTGELINARETVAKLHRLVQKKSRH